MQPVLRLRVQPSSTLNQWGSEGDWQVKTVVPLLVEQVRSLSNAVEMAQAQIRQLLSDPQANEIPLKVVTLDSLYPTPNFSQGYLFTQTWS